MGLFGVNIPTDPHPAPLCAPPTQVSAAANELRKRYNGQVGIVDDGSEHPHRLSMSMKSDVSERVTHKWSEELNKQGVKVRKRGVGGGGGARDRQQLVLLTVVAAVMAATWHPV